MRATSGRRRYKGPTLALRQISRREYAVPRQAAVQAEGNEQPLARGAPVGEATLVSSVHLYGKSLLGAKNLKKINFTPGRSPAAA